MRFSSGIFSIELVPDSRGYVLFKLFKRGERDPEVLEHLSVPLTCEYLADMIEVCVLAIKWIDANCEQIVVDGRHLYYKFKEMK